MIAVADRDEHLAAVTAAGGAEYVLIYGGPVRIPQPYCDSRKLSISIATIGEVEEKYVELTALAWHYACRAEQWPHQGDPALTEALAIVSEVIGRTLRLDLLGLLTRYDAPISAACRALAA